MYSDIRQLIPRRKGDYGRARSVVAAGYPAVDPILPDLLKWLQDVWPITHILEPFLVSIGAPLIPNVCDILNTDDDVWKYHVVGGILRNSREVAEALRPELERIAFSPTPSEKVEGVDEEALITLEQHGWYKTGAPQEAESA